MKPFLKYRYLIVDDEGLCFHTSLSNGNFYKDWGTFFKTYHEARIHWEALPYQKAIKCKIVIATIQLPEDAL